jgi:alpha-glucosidase
VLNEPMAKSAAQCVTGAPWWRGAVIYQVYPRSFLDTNADGIGDLAGITARLDYISRLGVDGVWISPFFRSPMADFGYDVSDYRDVDPIFGTLDDFDALMAKAKLLGLKLIIDQVYSHTSDQHPWFIESRASRDNPKADWYVWADPKADGSPPTNWQSVFKGSCWTWDARRGQYYLHNFLSQQPDLNLHNEAVRDEIKSIMRFWFDRGVSGIRLDAVNFMMHDPQLRDNPPVAEGVGKRTRPFDFQHHYYNQSHPDILPFLEELRALCNDYPGAFLVAEVGGEQADREMAEFTAPPHRLHSAYGFQYLYADQLTEALVRAAVTGWPDDIQTGWPSWTFSNHDAPRAVSRWANDAHRKPCADMLMVLLATLRGSVFLYQGEELGLPQAEVPFERLQDPEAIANWPRTLGRDGARTPLAWHDQTPHGGFSTADPWLPVDPRHLGLSVALQEGDPHSTLNKTRAMLELRRQHPALRVGAMTMHEASNDQVLAFWREAEGVRLLCVFNLTSTRQNFAQGKGLDPLHRVNQEFAGPGQLAPYGVVILRAPD